MLLVESMIDKENMLDVLGRFQEQCKEAINIARKAKIRIKGKITNVIVCGMGGSGIAADLAKALEKNIPIFVCKDYKLPSFANKGSLVFIVTYSGETEETLSCYLDAKRKRANIVVITSSERLARREKNSILIPSGYLPRLALGYLFLPVAVMLQKFKLIPAQDFAEALRIIVPRACSKEGFMVSKEIKNRIVLIYSSPSFAGIPYRIKTMINENAKLPAFAGTIPEINHNEMVSLKRYPKKFCILLIRDSTDHPQIKKRMEILKRLIKKKADVAEFTLKGKSLLAKLLHAAYVCDYVSYYLALMYKEDPTPLTMVAEFKEKLKEK